MTNLEIGGISINMKELDEDFDVWVHTERAIEITHCAPDSSMANLTKMVDQVYPITRFIRGRAILLANTMYQSLRLLKDIFTQMNYIIKIDIGKTDIETYNTIKSEANKEDNLYVDSFVVIIFGPPGNFQYKCICEFLNDEKSPILKGKPKLVYVIGDDDLVREVETSRIDMYPDILSVSTGFSGIMFYMFIICRFAHRLSAQSIAEVLMHNANYHRFAASTHTTMIRQFYFFPGLTTSVFPVEIEKLDINDMALYKRMLDEGSVKTYNVRLMFVGLFRAGKTSTVQRLVGQSIEHVTSTDGIDVQTGKCVVDIRNRQWRTIHDTTENMSNQQLRKLQLTDQVSRSNIPDIKSLENVDDNLHQGQCSNEEIGSQKDKTTYVVASTRRLITQLRNSKRSLPDTLPYTFANAAADISQPVSSNVKIRKLSSYQECQPNTSMPTSGSLPNTIDSSKQHKGSIDSMKIARRVLESTGKKKGVQYEEASVSLWDFAGQFVYYATHQLFFGPRSVYLLVVNLENDLEKTLTDWFMDIRGKQSIDVKGGINFWLRSIGAYGRSHSSGVPPIILVGTHGDKLSGTKEEKMKTANEYFKKIRNIFISTPLINNIRPRGFLLDNTIQDVEVEKLKDYILSVSQTMPYWGEEIPAKWLELELAIAEKQRQREPFISITQLEEIVESLASPFQDKDKLDLFLKAHHETGSFVYFGESEKLRNVVVLEPQWIINAFRSLIGATDFAKKYGPLQSRWKEFNDTGQLKKELARQIWEMDIHSRFYDNSDTLLDFLEHLDIIAQPTVLDEDGTEKNKLEFYYVPCMLKEQAPEDIIPRHNTQGTVSTPVLCLSFKEDFMPPAVFFRVVALCMGKWPVAQNGKTILMFCGCAVFELKYGKGVDLHRLYVFCRQSKIGIRITRYTNDNTKMVDPNICNVVRRFVTSAVKKEFSRFDYLGTTCAEDPFLLKIQCKETVEEDVMGEGLHLKEDLVNAVGTDFFCAEHSERIHLHSLKPVEMLHEWFNDDIPENFRFEGYSSSVIDSWARRLPHTLKQLEVSEKVLSRLSKSIGRNWRRLMVEQLGLKQVTVDQIEEDNPHSIRLQIFRCLLDWKSSCESQYPSTACTYGVLIDALKRARSKDVTIDFEDIQNVIDDI